LKGFRRVVTAPSDIIARVVMDQVGRQVGQNVIVDNRPGAASNIATEAIVRAPPDGHTLFLANGTNAVNATLYENLRFKFVRDTVPVAGIALGTYVMVVNPSVPARTVPQLIAYTKDNLDKVSMASAGIGSGPHVAGELFKTMTGTSMQHVPYRGTGAVWPDLLTGQVQVYFTSPVGSLHYVREGKLRALAVTTATRSDVLPGVPTVAETVPGFEVTTWFGIGAPKTTPAEIVGRLNRENNAGLAEPKIKARLADLGSRGFANSPADFGRFVAEETEKWGKVIRAANITPE